MAGSARRTAWGPLGPMYRVRSLPASPLPALMIPLNIGYAQVIGMPPTAGLYAAIIPLVVFALLTSSRNLITSPDASSAALVSAALVAILVPDKALVTDYVLAMALIAGLLFLLFWIFRLAFLGISCRVRSWPDCVRAWTGSVHQADFQDLAAPHLEESGTFADRIQEFVTGSIQTTGFLRNWSRCSG